MMRSIHVIASFNDMGKVIPLYFCLSLEKDAPTYKVKIRNVSENRFGSYVATYYCVSEINQENVEYRLIFDASNHNWQLVLGNSRSGRLH